MPRSAQFGLAALLALALVPSASCWGFQGHAVVCMLAKGLLSNKTAAQVQGLLPAGWGIGDVCSWPDVVGHSAPWHWSLPLHYVNTPDGVCHYSFSRDCHRSCVASAILNYTSQLSDYAHGNLSSRPTLSTPSSLSPGHIEFRAIADLPARVEAERRSVWSRLAPDGGARDHAAPPSVAAAYRTLFSSQGTAVFEVPQKSMEASLQGAAAVLQRYLQEGVESHPTGDFDPHVMNATVALMFLMHFVGDIHQPLHVGFKSDHGGNSIIVHWYKWKTNLHHVWDTEIISEELWKNYRRNIVTFAVHLANRLSEDWADQIDSWVKCPSGLVCPNSFAEESIGDACEWAYKDVKTGDTLQDPYFKTRSPIVEKDLVKAAVRLAATLNRIFDPQLSLALAL